MYNILSEKGGGVVYSFRFASFIRQLCLWSLYLLTTYLTALFSIVSLDNMHNVQETGSKVSNMWLYDIIAAIFCLLPVFR